VSKLCGDDELRIEGVLLRRKGEFLKREGGFLKEGGRVFTFSSKFSATHTTGACD
jgi:hypothetical protein